jgi:hypothetical protein
MAKAKAKAKAMAKAKAKAKAKEKAEAVWAERLERLWVGLLLRGPSTALPTKCSEQLRSG